LAKDSTITSLNNSTHNTNNNYNIIHKTDIQQVNSVFNLNFFNKSSKNDSPSNSNNNRGNETDSNKSA